MAEAYLHAKFHLDPSNRLATVHQRYRQDRQTDNGLIAKGEPFYKRLPKNVFNFTIDDIDNTAVQGAQLLHRNWQVHHINNYVQSAGWMSSVDSL